MRIRQCCEIALAFAALAFSAEQVWDRAPASWTKAEAQSILDNSPWSQSINAAIIPVQSEEARRAGGVMGQEHGLGYDLQSSKSAGLLGSWRSSPQLQTVPLLIRWESALPVRVAELRSGQTGVPLDAFDGCILAIYRIPGTYFGDPGKWSKQLVSSASLESGGHPLTRPEQATVYQMSDGVAAVYYFPSTAVEDAKASIYFQARIGRLQISKAFLPEKMRFQGALALATSSK